MNSCVISYSDPARPEPPNLYAVGELCSLVCLVESLDFVQKDSFFAFWPNNYLVMPFWDLANFDDLPSLGAM